MRCYGDVIYNEALTREEGLEAARLPDDVADKVDRHGDGYVIRFLTSNHSTDVKVYRRRVRRLDDARRGRGVRHARTQARSTSSSWKQEVRPWIYRFEIVLC